jgi:hypothetical protein
MPSLISLLSHQIEVCLVLSHQELYLIEKTAS